MRLILDAWPMLWALPLCFGALICVVVANKIRSHSALIATRTMRPDDIHETDQGLAQLGRNLDRGRGPSLILPSHASSSSTDRVDVQRDRLICDVLPVAKAS